MKRSDMEKTRGQSDRADHGGHTQIPRADVDSAERRRGEGVVDGEQASNPVTEDMLRSRHEAEERIIDK